jgi:hypothetical protein
MPSTLLHVRRITRRYPARTVLHQTAGQRLSTRITGLHSTAVPSGAVRAQTREPSIARLPNHPRTSTLDRYGKLSSNCRCERKRTL